MHGRGSLRGAEDRQTAVIIFSYLTHMVPGSHGSDGPLGGDGGSDGWCVTAEEATTLRLRVGVFASFL